MPGKARDTRYEMTAAELEALLAETAPTMPGRAKFKGEGSQVVPQAVRRGRGSATRRCLARNKKPPGDGETTC